MCWLKSNKHVYNVLFVCVCVLGFFFVQPENFSLHYEDVIIACERLQILIYALHSWPLRIYGSLACHTYCETGHSYLMVISEDPWHSHLSLSVLQWSCRYLFLRLRFVAAWIRIPNLPLERQTLLPMAPPPQLCMHFVSFEFYTLHIVGSVRCV